MTTKTYRVQSITANGNGPRIDITVQVADRKAALVKGKMAFSREYGKLPASGLRFEIEEVK